VYILKIGAAVYCYRQTTCLFVSPYMYQGSDVILQCNYGVEYIEFNTDNDIIARCMS